MLDLAEKQSIDTVDSAAYTTSAHPRSNSISQLSRSDPKTSRSSTSAIQECSWRKKQGNRHMGNVYNDCRRLKELQDSRAGSGKKQKASSSRANVVTILDDESGTESNAFTASMDTNGKQAC